MDKTIAFASKIPFNRATIIYIHDLLPQMRNSQDTLVLSVYFLVELNTSKILFFRMSLMDGINLIQTFVALIVK